MVHGKLKLAPEKVAHSLPLVLFIYSVLCTVRKPRSLDERAKRAISSYETNGSLRPCECVTGVVGKTVNTQWP